MSQKVAIEIQALHSPNEQIILDSWNVFRKFPEGYSKFLKNVRTVKCLENVSGNFFPLSLSQVMDKITQKWFQTSPRKFSKSFPNNNGLKN